MTSRLASLAAATLAAASLLPAQAVWTQRMPAGMPTGRTGAAYASDGSGLLVFGGLDSTATYGSDLWRFDGTSWTNLTPSPLPANWPAGRYRHAAAWDLGRGRLVVFGGGFTSTASTRTNETWVWDGAQWTQHFPANSPSARWWHSMAYDPRNGNVLLFGGQDSSGRLNDTWSWDGTNWTQLSPTNLPPARERAAIATNIVTGEILLFGGNPGGGTPLGDTWIWDGMDWRLLTTATIPYGAGCRNAGMTYDLVRERYVLFGGVSTVSNSEDKTWEFDGTDWTERVMAVPPPGRTFPNMAFVLSLGKTIMFSGFTGTAGSYHQDLWEYQTNAVASYTGAGSGCAGSTGVPILSNLSLPWLGTTTTVHVNGLAPTALPFMLIGLSSTTWAGGSLPFPLTAFGAPQCDLLVSPDATTFLANQGGTASWSFGLPTSPRLIGFVFHNQCIAVEPGGSGFTLGATARGTATIGAL